MTGAEFIYLMIGAGVGTICGFLIGYNHKLTDAELRSANDERSIDFPENSKIKSPDDWPRGGI